MGLFDEYCTICGGPPFVSFEEDGEPLPPSAPNADDYTWLRSFVGISTKEEVIFFDSYDDSGRFSFAETDLSRFAPFTLFSIGDRDVELVGEEAPRGYACHVACYNLLQQELNYTLKYADVRPLLADKKLLLNSFSWTDYGGLADYHGSQFFTDVELDCWKDGNMWMIEDPSRNAQNRERILKLWRPLLESGFQKPETSPIVLGDDGRSAPEMDVKETTKEMEELDLEA